MCTTLSTFSEHNAVDAGSYAVAVDSWWETRADPPIPVSRPYYLPTVPVNRAAYPYARHSAWARKFTFSNKDFRLLEGRVSQQLRKHFSHILRTDEVVRPLKRDI